MGPLFTGGDTVAKPMEKDSLQILKSAIKAGQPANLYVFHGAEVFLLHHYLEQLKKVVLDELTESFNFHRFTNETFDLRDFADAVENLPMMAERTMVQVDDIDIFKLNEDSRDKIVDILSDIPEYCTVVFTYETVVWKPDKRLKKLWDAVSKYGCQAESAGSHYLDPAAFCGPKEGHRPGVLRLSYRHH